MESICRVCRGCGLCNGKPSIHDGGVADASLGGKGPQVMLMLLKTPEAQPAIERDGQHREQLTVDRITEFKDKIAVSTP